MLLALVPARGGSKGLPQKNARSLGGLPLLGWTVEAVRASGVVPSAFVLSTDDAALASIGREVGLDVPFMRPAELATDTASAMAVIDHALAWFARERDMVFDAIAYLQPTSPFRPPQALAEAMRLLEDPDVPAVIGVMELHRSPATLFRTDEQRRLNPLAEGEAQRRQDLEPLVTPNGALYVTRTEVLRRERTVFPKRTRAIVMDRIASIDIDDATDWALAEAVVTAGLAWRR